MEIDVSKNLQGSALSVMLDNLYTLDILKSLLREFSVYVDDIYI